MTWAKMPNFIIPALVFLGLFAFRFPLYGFVDFFGFLMLVVNTTPCFQRIEHPGVTRVQFLNAYVGFEKQKRERNRRSWACA